MARDNRDDPVDPGLADRSRDVGVVDPDAPVRGERGRGVLGEPTELDALAERDVARHRQPRERPVHRAGFEVAEAESLREPAGDRALPRSRGPVDGNDHRCVTDSSSSKNPGELPAPASAPSISTPSLEGMPETPPPLP